MYPTKQVWKYTILAQPIELIEPLEGESAFAYTLSNKEKDKIWVTENVIYYRNFEERNILAKRLGGRLPNIDELKEIYNSLKGNTNDEKLKWIALFISWRYANGAELCDLGCWAALGSGSLGGDGFVRTLNAHRDSSGTDDGWYSQGSAVSSVVVLDICGSSDSLSLPEELTINGNVYILKR